MAVKVNTSSGVGDVNAWQNGARQVRGFFDSILKANPSWNNGLRQMQQINPGLAHGAEQLGSFFTGTPERKLQQPKWGGGAPQKPAAPAPSPALNLDAAQQTTSNNPNTATPDLLSFLGQAMDILRQNGGLAGGGTDYGALKSQLQGQYNENDARLAAMYGQLQKSYAADAPAIAQGYDQAVNSVGQNAQAAAQTTNDAYQAARDAQTQQLQALGIQDAAGVLAAQGGRAAADQAQANANIQQDANAVQNQLTTNKAAAGNYNTNIGHAAGLEGAMQRATLQQQLAQALAKLDVQQSSEASQAGQTNFNNALSLASQLYQDSTRKSDAEAAAEAANAKQQYQMYRDSQGDALKQQSVLATLYPALLRQYGGDDAKAQAAAKALGLL